LVKIGYFNRPILRGRDIKKYCYDFADLYLINTHNGIKEKGIKPVRIDDYPAIKKHLDSHLPQLEKRQDKGDSVYNLRNCAYIEDFSKQKIIWIELADKGRFAIDILDNFLTLNGTFIMTGNDLEFICAVLNNPITSWHFNTFCISSGVGTNQWRELYVRNLLIPNIPIEKRITVLKFMKEINDLERAKKDYKIKTNELNMLIYNLFELNKEEIQYIELQ